MNNYNSKIDHRCVCGKKLCEYQPNTDGPYAFEIKCSNSKCKKINYHGNVISLNLVELRCPSIDEKRSARFGKSIVCNKLLAKVLPGTRIYVKCPRCGAIVSSEIIESRLAATEQEPSTSIPETAQEK